jgi:phosphate transport system protein
MPDSENNSSSQIPLRVANDIQLDHDISALRRRVIREASRATDLIRQSLQVLTHSTEAEIKEIRDIEREIDQEEVRIEEECFRILALQQPFGSDFRMLTFCLKVNSDIERLADHAASIAKISKKLGEVHLSWPKAMIEMIQRVPLMCDELLRAVISADPEAAREVVIRDKAIDKLDKQAFRELTEIIQNSPDDASKYMLMYRVSRELERVGDLLGNIAEDIIYLVTGDIVRHEHKGANAKQ